MRVTRPVTLLTAIAAFTGAAYGQGINDTLRSLSSPIDTVRIRAFHQLSNSARSRGVPFCTQGTSPDIATALIALLVRETTIFSHHTRPISEDENEFYPDVVGCVAGLRDQRALEPLMAVINTGWMAMDGVLALGEPAVARLADVIHSPTAQSDSRNAAVLTLGAFVAGTHGTAHLLSPSGRDAARMALIDALLDPDVAVRVDAVQGLAPFSDPSVRTAIDAAAARDTGVVHPNGERHFLIRAAAQKWAAAHDQRHPRGRGESTEHAGSTKPPLC